MWKWVASFFALLAGVALVAPPQKAHQEQPQGHSNQSQAVAPILEPTASAPEGQQAANNCPGSYHPQLKCDAISANADEDQARNSENQTWWFRWEVLLTFGTLIVAGFAMEFARQAARHNRRSADAAERADRPHLLPSQITLSDPSSPDADGKLDFTYKFTNHGSAPAWIKRYAIVFEMDTKVPERPSKFAYSNENAAVPPKEGWGLIEPLKIGFPPDQMAGIADGSLYAVLFCAIEYIGVSGQKYVHKFAQQYIPGHKRLRPIESPFWEYT